jgi:hypothetical protein
MPSTCSGRWRTGGSGGAHHVHESRRVAPRRRALSGRDGNFLVVSDVVEDNETQRHARSCCRRRCGSEGGVTGRRTALPVDAEAARPARAGAQRPRPRRSGRSAGTRQGDHPARRGGLGRGASIDHSLYNFRASPTTGSRGGGCGPAGDRPGTERGMSRVTAVRQQGAGIEFYGNHDKAVVISALPAYRKTTAEYPLYPPTGRVLGSFHRHDDGPDYRATPGDRRRDVRTEPADA